MKHDKFLCQIKRLQILPNQNSYIGNHVNVCKANYVPRNHLKTLSITSQNLYMNIFVFILQEHVKERWHVQHVILYSDQINMKSLA